MEVPILESNRIRVIQLFVSASLLLTLSCGDGATGLSQNGICLEYPSAGSSQYILPFPEGASYRIGQGNCTSNTHSGKGRYAYDMSLQIGDPIHAARAGTVRWVIESNLDADNARGNENMIVIEHSDLSAAYYVHLTKDGALFDVGETVEQGQQIAISGASGTDDPHLHFQVVKTFEDFDSIPVTFRNANLAHPNGLVQGTTYTAETFEANSL